MGGITLLHDGKHPIGVYGRTVFEFFIGEDILAIDDHPVFLAKVCFEFRHCLIEALVQFLGRVEHRGVREFESHASSWGS